MYGSQEAQWVIDTARIGSVSVGGSPPVSRWPQVEATTVGIAGSSEFGYAMSDVLAGISGCSMVGVIEGEVVLDMFECIESG